MSGALTNVIPGSAALPALFAPDPEAAKRFVEFFTANIRNPNTRKAYARAAADFAAWCEQMRPARTARHRARACRGLCRDLQTRLARRRSSSTWPRSGCCSTGWWSARCIAVNPASCGARPEALRQEGQDAGADGRRGAGAARCDRDPDSAVGLRDRALIGLMVYTFARVGAALKMQVEDVYVQGRRTWVRLHEKGGKRHEMPCHHNLDSLPARLYRRRRHRQRRQGRICSAPRSRRTGQLSDRPMTQADVYRMIRRRAAAAGIHHQDRLSLLPRHRDHRIPQERRQARSRAADGQPRKRAHDRPLRPAQRSGQPR